MTPRRHSIARACNRANIVRKLAATVGNPTQLYACAANPLSLRERGSNTDGSYPYPSDMLTLHFVNGLIGQLIHTLVFIVAAVAAHPVPTHLVWLSSGIETFP